MASTSRALALICCIVISYFSNTLASIEVSRQCKSDQFSCGRECIPSTWRCDKQQDCPDTSDEKSCPGVSCSADQFRCTNDKCVSLKWKCDVGNDCGDNSDEENCPATSCWAREFRCGNKKCVPERYRCNGHIDCLDGSDEVGCPQATISPCLEEMFMCRNGDCIPLAWQCDTDPDCHDLSDEEGCGNLTCNFEDFTCASKYKNLIECIPGYQQCDGNQDCHDGSDEVGCPTSRPGVNCVPLEELCQRLNECVTKKDQATALCDTPAVNECLINKGGCHHECHDTRIGYYCRCREGFHLHSDNKTCLDINECAIPATCSQKCVNTHGSYKCSCYEGYVPSPNQDQYCKATGDEPSLLISNGHDLREFKIHRNAYSELIDRQRRAVSLDYDYKRQFLYWCDLDVGIMAANLRNLHRTPEVVGYIDNSTSVSVALDWIHNNLYRTNPGWDRIEIRNLNTHRFTMLFHGGLKEVRGLVLDPRDNQGYMYWSHWGVGAKIEKAGMDGSHRQTIVHTSLKWPNGLAIDYEANRLYWVDAKLDLIASSDLHGHQRRVILSTKKYLHHAFSLDVFEDNIYWTDRSTHSIHTVSKYNASVSRIRTLAFDLIAPMGIRVFHALKQPNGSNRCVNNGGCSHLCLPSPYIHDRVRYSCHCEPGIELDSDKKTCLTPAI